MYKTFFGLIRNPFDISPDPYFLFPTQRHNEALASIAYGVLQRKGFMVLTGEVGTGKTLMVRCLMESLRTRGVETANIFNPRLRPLEFLLYVIGDLGMTPASQDNKGTVLLQLYNHLIVRQRAKRSTVLIVDEAQNMDFDLLEELRLLTNLETAEQKLLQIVLVGQPELDQKMDSTQLRQLKQRITLRCHLEPLKEEETKAYICQRLERSGAGSRAASVFCPPAINAVHKYSQGIPRLINTICENALIAAYAKLSNTVREEMIDEVATDLRLHVVSHPAIPDSGLAEGQRKLVRTMLDLIDALERITRSPAPQPPEVRTPSKIV